MLKRLGYPEVVEPNKPSTVLQKAIIAVGKRTARLDSISTSFGTVEKPSTLLTKPEPHLQCRNKIAGSNPLSFNISNLRLSGKVQHLYQQLDAITDELEEFKTGGVLDGFSDEPLGYVTILDFL